MRLPLLSPSQRGTLPFVLADVEVGDIPRSFAQDLNTPLLANAVCYFEDLSFMKYIIKFNPMAQMV